MSMKPHLTTAPGRIDIHLRGERFATYETGGAPGFTAIHANGLRAVTQLDASVGRCLWMMHGSVNGAAFGTGTQSDRPSGHVVTSDLSARRGSQSVGFRHECSWIAPDGVCLLHESRTVRVTEGPSSGGILDIGITLTSVGRSIELGQSDDALLCTRVASSLLPSGGGQLRNSRDDFGSTDVHGRQASWCACNGVVNGETVGLAILDHPNNPWHPPPWVVSENGLISPSPYAWRKESLSPGSVLALRCRIVVHSGYVEAGWIQARMTEWLRER